MKNNRYRIEGELNQVIDGEEYFGKVNIDGMRFSYKLKFNSHLRGLKRTKKGLEKLLEQTDIHVTGTRRKKIKLDKKSKKLFFDVMGIYAIAFYSSPDTRQANRQAQGYAHLFPIEAGCSMSGTLEHNKVNEKVLSYLRNQIS